METVAKYDGGNSLVNLEDSAMPVAKVMAQISLIQQVMSQAMKEGEHYGIIPGTKKPTLLKPGAEKLSLTFRLDPDYEILREIREKDFIAYTVKCALTHIPTEKKIASGIGSCNSRETKYRFRYEEEDTGNLVPKEYWKAKSENDNKEMKRILGEGNRAAKIDGKWVVAKSTKIENDNPWDLDNTIIKMACKRALVAATLNATAASDIFTQDIEDLPAELIGKKPEHKPEEPPPQASTAVHAEEGDQKTEPPKTGGSSKTGKKIVTKILRVGEKVSEKNSKIYWEIETVDNHRLWTYEPSIMEMAVDAARLDAEMAIEVGAKNKIESIKVDIAGREVGADDQ